MIENDLFTSTHLEKIVSLLQGGTETFGSFTILKFFSEYLSLLSEHKFLTPEIVAALALKSDEIFPKHFHTLKSAGFLGRETLTEMFKQAQYPYGFETDVLPHIASTLASDANWMSSPSRWKDLLVVLKDTHKMRALLEIVKKGEEVSSDDIAGLFSFFSMASESQVREAEKVLPKMTWLRPQYLREFEETANRLGVADDNRFKDAFAKVTISSAAGEGGLRLLTDWALSGMNKVWAGYKLTGDEKLDKRTKKAFLNYLEREAKRTPPNRARIVTKRGWQIVEEDFARRLTEGISAEESARFEAINKSQVWAKLKSSQLYWMLISASGFMNQNGMAAMRRLILGLKIEDGRLVYPRYDELKGVLPDEFLTMWREEYSKEMKGMEALDAGAGQKTMKTQVIAQVGGHMSVKEGVELSKVPEVIRNLPARVAKWHAEFSKSDLLNDETLKEARAIRNIFEAHYGEIRAHFGDTFAGVRTDLRNFIDGMEKGVRVARKSEQFEVSGNIEKIARSGSEPVTTCQTFEYAWVNIDGQPIGRLIHGQFKLANWIMDGTVVARRLLEVTVDDEGKMHLLAERLYSSGGFGRVKEFRAEILKYAGTLGIDEASVHFADEAATMKTAPLPMATGDAIYRDTFREEGMTLEEARNIRRNRGSGIRDIGTVNVETSDPVSRVPNPVSAIDLSKDLVLKGAVIPDGQTKAPSAAVRRQRQTADHRPQTTDRGQRTTGKPVIVRPSYFFTTP